MQNKPEITSKWSDREIKSKNIKVGAVECIIETGKKEQNEKKTHFS